MIGLGYVGLPLLRAFFQAGFPVIGFDVDPAKIAALKAGETTSSTSGEDFVREMAGSGRFDATTDFARLGEADAVISCVPTPLGTHLEPDLSFVENSADDIAATLRPGQLIVLESSTYPGTTREVMLPRFEAAGLQVRPAISSSPTPPSAKTPAARTTTRRPSPSSSAASTPPAARWPPPCTARRSSR